jgi:TetR/AcrR family transcriptional regulator
MSPRTTVQNEIIREERKAQILDAALHVFAEEGYHSASVSKVARRAEISKGLMYNFFIVKKRCFAR